jgi:glyoxylase-like metal-dependent hydrolase (beta-lactamase superfamily II)
MRVTHHGATLVQLTRLPRLLPVNCYLVREADGLTLVDAGLPGSADAILRAAAALGQPVVRIVITHAHADHVGSLDALRQQLPAAELCFPARDALFLAGDKSLDPGEPQAKLRGSYQRVAARPDRLLAEGDRVGSLQVIAAPGHTPGQIALFDPRDRALIVGDAFSTRGGLAVAGKLNWRFPLPAIATWHRPTALASARRLRALDPALLATGHGDLLAQPLAAMDAAIAAAAQRVAEDATRGA